MSNLTPTDLMLQARDTAETYFNQSIRIIDSKFGEGYAKAHPELIAGFMRTAAMDFHTAILNQKLDSLICEIFELYRCNDTTINQEIEIDYHQLEMDADVSATSFVVGAGESLGALLGYPPGNEIEVMKKHPVLVVTHALIAFVDYELSIKRKSSPAGKHNE